LLLRTLLAVPCCGLGACELPAERTVRSKYSQERDICAGWVARRRPAANCMADEERPAGMRPRGPARAAKVVGARWSTGGCVCDAGAWGPLTTSSRAHTVTAPSQRQRVITRGAELVRRRVRSAGALAVSELYLTGHISLSRCGRGLGSSLPRRGGFVSLRFSPSDTQGIRRVIVVRVLSFLVCPHHNLR
jgi:hypothetical protein